MRGQGKRLWGAAALALVTGDPALAQDSGGLQMTLGVTERLEASENAGLTDPSSGRLTSSTTSLSFGLSSETRSQILRLNASGALRFEFGDGAAAPNSFDNPSFSAFYSVTNANSALTLQASADRSLLARAMPTVEDPDPQGEGTRLQYSASALLDLGTGGPLGLTLEAGQSGARFSDADQADTETLKYSATGHLRFASGATARLSASQSDYDEDAALNLRRETSDVSLGWTQPLSPVLSLDASVGQQRVDTRLAGFLTDRTEGLSGQAGLTLDLANGQAGLRLSQSQEPGAVRQTILAERQVDLGNQTIEVTLGTTRQDDAQAVAIGSLRWTHLSGVGELSIDLGRSVGSGGLDTEVTTDRLSLGLSREVGASGRVSLDLTAVRIDETAADLVERTDLSASYSRDLGQDWRMSVGASMTRRDQEGEASATSRLIFLSISRDFNLRP